MFKDNKILILGMARSGYGAAKMLAERGNTVFLNEAKTEDKMDKDQVAELRSLGVNLVFGSHPDDLLDSSFDYLIKNPGVPIDHKYVLKARELGIEVINEVEMAYRLLPEDVSIIGITGTNGKTTTTSLTYEIMHRAFGEKVHLAGNIGYPLSGILKDVKSGDIIVIECSCQQGENFINFHPHVGIFTNLSEAHIDFMKTYDYYKEVKSRMFYNQSSDDIAIMNYDNSDVMEKLNDVSSIKRYFSSKENIDGCHLVGNNIYYYNEEVMNINDIKIKGMHNVENVMAAIMAVKEYGVSNDIIKEVVSNFKGVEHRLEYVDTVNGVEYYNDTEATNIKCAQIALSSFKKPIIIFLGGLERGQDFSELTPYMDYVKAIIAIGQCRDRVAEYAKSIGKDVYVYEHLVDGFDKCSEIAVSGDVVLLSPASASWDQYKECEVRGAEFKGKVRELKGEVNE
ncbi:MAG: UDP-N-acetylmuramoyl-L-alanine--D-glutamate ligase [Bacilli bacterium]|nr:UDP-N-acetylmuramoyl-L-alanine--D-glutamate ligase [Bacilli bacterium]